MGHVQKTAKELQVHTYLVTKKHCIVDPHIWCYIVQQIVLEIAVGNQIHLVLRI